LTKAVVTTGIVEFDEVLYVVVSVASDGDEEYVAAVWPISRACSPSMSHFSFPMHRLHDGVKINIFVINQSDPRSGFHWR
jgi:hypothetical protein